MGTFEETVAKAKEALDVAGKKTSAMINVQKLKVNLATAKSQLSKLYETLGRLCFESGSCDDAAIAELKGDIEAKIADVRDLEAKLATAKGEKICEACFVKNTATADYCNKCGQKLGAKAEPEECEAEECDAE